MTEQEKITALFEKLPPDKKAVFIMFMRSFANMFEMVVTLTNENGKQ